MKIRTFLGSSDKTFILKCLLFSEAIFGVSHYSHHLCHLDSSLIFLFFWSRPSNFKSSFKLRKGHFSTVQFSEKLPSPTESHSPGVKQSHARTSGPIGKSSWTLLFTTSLRMHSPGKGGLSVTHVIFKKERAIWRGLRFDHQKSAQWKQVIMNNGH